MKVCIVGTSRSGTTLLRSLLNQNPELSLFNETHWIPRMFDFFGTQSIDWKDILKVAQKTTWDTGQDLISVNTQFSQFNSSKELLNALTRELKHHGSVTIQEFSKIFADVTFDCPTFWGDKTPDYGYYMGIIQYLWPQCKFIHVVRDGLATARSMSKHPGCQLMTSGGYHNWCSLSYDRLYEQYRIKNNSINQYIHSWCIRMRRIRNESKRLRPNSYLEVKYEDILYTTHEVIKTIDDFIELPDTLSKFKKEDLGIITSKANPATEVFDQLKTNNVKDLQIINQGYGQSYFHQYNSQQDLADAMSEANFNYHYNYHGIARKIGLSILASSELKENSDIKIRALELLDRIDTQ